MFAAERRISILEKLERDKKVVVSELSLEFEVSEETIRRDLEKLEKEGLAVKSYGGATLKEGYNDQPFGFRIKKNMEGKAKIGRIIEKLVNDGDHITVDASTTGIAIVQALRDKEALTVITNSVDLLLSQQAASNWEFICTGGYFKEEYLALVGPVAISTIQNFYVDKVLMSCQGLDMERGVTDASELFSQLKQAMLKSAKEKILAVDHSKFNRIGFSKVCSIIDVDIVVTDKKPSDAWLKYFDEKGIRCLYEE